MSHRSPITTHILDLQTGSPASGVDVILERYDEVGAWIRIATGCTDADGRIEDLLKEKSLEAAAYRLTFELRPYFERNDRPIFYPRATVEFIVSDAAEHYHVPLLLSSFGYSTYRGS